MDTNFTRGATYKIWKGKNAQNSARSFTTFDFDRKYPRNGSTCRKSEKCLITYISSPTRQKIHPQIWSTNQKVIGAHVYPPNWTFSGDYISEIFTRSRHWPRLASAHHKPGRVSPNNFNGEHLKLGLKFHIYAPITLGDRLGIVGVTSQNFTGCGSQPGWWHGH